MPTESDFVFVQLPDGSVEGPFEFRKVVRAHRAGKLPTGTCFSASREGPWQSVADSAGAADERPEGDELGQLGIEQTPRAESSSPNSAPPPPTTPSLPPPVPPTGVGASVSETPTGRETCMELLQRAVLAMRSRYWPIVARTYVTLTLASLFLAIPSILWAAAFSASHSPDQSGKPWFVWLESSPVLVQFIAPLLFAPLGLMFLVCGVLCVLGSIEGSAWSGWGSLFAWRKRFLPMMILGYVAAGTELGSYLLSALLFERRSSSSRIIESALSQFIEACPLVLCMLAGMLVMTAEPKTGSPFGSVGSALKWAMNSLVEGRGSTSLALLAAVLFAAICGPLVLPLLFFGLPFLTVVVGLGFRRYELYASA